MPVLPDVASRIVRSRASARPTLRRRESSAPPRDPSPSRRDSATRPSRRARRRASRARTGAGARAACGRSGRGPTSRHSDRAPGNLGMMPSAILYTTELVRIISTSAATLSILLYSRRLAMTSASSDTNLTPATRSGRCSRDAGLVRARRLAVRAPHLAPAAAGDRAAADSCARGRRGKGRLAPFLGVGDASRSAKASGCGACTTSARSRARAAIASARSSRPDRLRSSAIRSTSATSRCGSASPSPRGCSGWPR